MQRDPRANPEHHSNTLLQYIVPACRRRRRKGHPSAGKPKSTAEQKEQRHAIRAQNDARRTPASRFSHNFLMNRDFHDLRLRHLGKALGKLGKKTFPPIFPRSGGREEGKGGRRPFLPPVLPYEEWLSSPTSVKPSQDVAPSTQPAPDPSGTAVARARPSGCAPPGRAQGTWTTTPESPESGTPSSRSVFNETLLE